jgi:hypothetical protein
LFKNSKVSIQDRHFIVGWSLRDTAKVEEYTKRLVSIHGKAGQQAEYTRLADEMITLIEKQDNDHRNATADLAGHDWLRVQPLLTQVGEDLCTFQGLNKLLQVYLGTASGVFKWVGRGSASGTPTPYTVALATETGSRQDSTSTGFQDLKGASLRVFSSYASSVASVTMYQIGIFDASANGTMLAIHDFGGIGYSHVQNTDSFSLGLIVDFVPFGDI